MSETRNEYGFPLAADMDDDVSLDLELVEFEPDLEAEAVLRAQLLDNEPQIAVQDDYDGYADLFNCN